MSMSGCCDVCGKYLLCKTSACVCVKENVCMCVRERVKERKNQSGEGDGGDDQMTVHTPPVAANLERGVG